VLTHSIGVVPLELAQLAVLLTNWIRLAFAGDAAGSADTATGVITCPLMQTLPPGAPEGQAAPIDARLPAGAVKVFELESKLHGPADPGFVAFCAQAAIGSAAATASK
jgi:hypothetical protein